MRQILLLFLIPASLVLAGCEARNENLTQSPQNSNNANTQTTYRGSHRVEFKSDPAEVKAGEKTNLIFSVKKESGEITRDLEIVHEKPMHLIIVSDDLNEFYHQHPEPQADGRLLVNFTFPNGGRYRLYTDFKPKGGEPAVQNFPLQVAGPERAPQILKPDEKPEKTIEGLKVAMNSDAELESNKELLLNFTVTDAVTNEPVTDLENYLGEKAHFVIISRDLREFVHAHPVSTDGLKEEHKHDTNTEPENKLMTPPANSTIAAHVQFPGAGIYKIFVEIKRGGKVFTAAFVVEVKQGKTEKILSDVKIPDGAIKVVVSKDGFTPEEISLPKDQPAKLAFVRVDEENCADEVVFKDLNITKKLPVGEVVLVDIPAGKTGEINFACGMDMFKGKVIVQ